MPSLHSVAVLSAILCIVALAHAGPTTTPPMHQAYVKAIRQHTAKYAVSGFQAGVTPSTLGSMPLPLAQISKSGRGRPRPMETCKDGSVCTGGEECCSGGAFCCANTAACCNDTCCDKFSQSCCPDPTNGGVCCESQDTACCPPNPTTGLPSRCCPRWFVCCTGGKYGCCDPGTGLPMEEFEAQLEALGLMRSRVQTVANSPSRRMRQSIATDTTTTTTTTTTAYALMVAPNLKDGTPFIAMTLDTASGKRTAELTVSGFNDWGEETRRFTLDRKRNLFYLPQANFTGPGVDSSRQIHIYKVDPVKGSTAVTAVTGGPTGLVTGFVYDNNKDVLVMATQATDGSGGFAGWLFWDVNVDTGAASQVSAQNGTSPSSTWAGYFRQMAYVGQRRLLYRMGFLDVIDQTNPGLGVTDISTANAVTATVPVSPPKGYLPMINAIVSSSSGTDFVSMAPGDGLLNSDISLFKWSISVPSTGSLNVSASAVTKVAALGNAHPVPKFGPLGYDVDATFTTFGALVVHDSLDSDFDLWALSEVDLASGSQKTTVVDPMMLAQTNSVSGFGYPSTQSQPQRK